MKKTLEISKLAALRLKTDRQLVAFIESRLSGATPADAQRIQSEVSELLPLVDGLSGLDRRKLQVKLERLHELAAAVEPRVLSMCG